MRENQIFILEVLDNLSVKTTFDGICINHFRAGDSNVDIEACIEGFHDAVCTPYELRPGRHVGFFGTTKYALILYRSILFEKIKLMVSERTYIILFLYGVIRLYEV